MDDSNAFTLTPWIVAGLILTGLAIILGASVVFKGSIHA